MKLVLFDVERRPHPEEKLRTQYVVTVQSLAGEDAEFSGEGITFDEALDRAIDKAEAGLREGLITR